MVERNEEISVEKKKMCMAAGTNIPRLSEIGRSVHRMRDLSCFVSTRYILRRLARSIFIIKFLYKWGARDASRGNIFLRVSSKVRCNLHPSCFISDRVLFPRFSLCAHVRDVDEMSSGLISLWLMRALINNSHFWWRVPARVSRNLSLGRCEYLLTSVLRSASERTIALVNSLPVLFFLFYSTRIISNVKTTRIWINQAIICWCVVVLYEKEKSALSIYATITSRLYFGQFQISRRIHSIIPIGVKKKIIISNFTFTREEKCLLK